MRKLFFLFIIALSALSVLGQAQNNSNCPTLLFSIEGEGVVDEGQNIRIYAFIDNGTRDDNGLITESISFKEQLKYKWKASPETEIILENPWEAFLKPQPIQDKQVTVSVEVEGLPEGCKNSFSTNFTVKINYHCRYIPPFDDYGKLSVADENARINAAILQLREMLKEDKEAALIFFIYGSNPKEFQSKKSRISKYLTMKSKISEQNFKFVDGGISESRTQVYIYPKEAIQLLFGINKQ